MKSLALTFCLFLIFLNALSQKLVDFKVSECQTNCKFETSTIERLVVSGGSTEVSIRTLANCIGRFDGNIEILDKGVLNLIFSIKPTATEGIDENGDKIEVIEVALCDCPFDFTYKILGFELKDPLLIRVNGQQLSELPRPLVEETQVEIKLEDEEKVDENQI